MECLKCLVFLLVVSAFQDVNSSSSPSPSPSLSSSSEAELASTVKLLSEQVNALLDHRQEDYNALENSLKKAIEENTELMVLRNEVRQLRKEVSGLRGGSGNEAKNERLRIKWLGSAVTELKSELAEVLRTQNASEELAQRALMKSELSLLRGDIAQVGRGIRDLGGRLTRIEASLGTIRDDITSVKERAGQLTRSCADVASQLSTVQIEMKSLKWEPTVQHKHHQLARNEIYDQDKRDHHRSMRHSLSRSLAGRKIEERLSKLERKIAIVARKRAMIEKRVVFETNPEVANNLKEELSNRIDNITNQLDAFKVKVEQSAENLEIVETLEDKQESLQLEMKRAIAHLDLNAARKNAELSLTREELGNLRKTVQALSVSASKLQEKSDLQQETTAKLTKQLDRLSNLNLTSSVAKAINVTHELEHVEDQYRLMVDALPGNCDARDGLTLLGVGQGAPLLVSCHDEWIVVARRVDGIVDFDRTWSEYASGFGSPLNEFWVGNEALHRLTRDNCTRLRIDLTDIYGSKWRADYDYFTVQSEDTGYQLHVGGYSGNATDAFSYQNGMSFSAKDRDMDISTADCAANYHGGWWFSHCQHANLNARYSLGLTWYQSDTNEWMAVGAATMSIQRKNDCHRT
ncbi:protein scabrous-like [Microplitis mediator]|uniref:protein scabrous-like n=1 Tax=Microplitis mediator TaxID=375433 RepID=UPI002555949E|nr:protein scabrous-like [Microplitis mediator]